VLFLGILMADIPQTRPTTAAEQTAPIRTGSDLIAALQASPYREIDIEPARYRLLLRDVAP